MNDRDLALNVVVNCGIGTHGRGIPTLFYLHKDIPATDQEGLKADKFVRDWRVAGALMERCAKENSLDGRTIALSFGVGMFCATRAGSASPTYGVYLERTNKSAPRAIIEACVEALS